MATATNQGTEDPSSSSWALPDSAFVRAAHLFVLASFAVAEPLFSLLKPGSAFFAVHRSEPVDLLVLVLVLALALPLSLWAAGEARGLLRRGLGRCLYGSVVALLLTLTVAGHSYVPWGSSRPSRGYSPWPSGWAPSS